MNRGELAELAAALAAAIRDEVAPLIGRREGREHSGGAVGGDITFAIDERAESLMESFLAERAPEVAFYSEDRGLVTPAGDAEWVLVVDPIDGTRPAIAGFEAACVSVAGAPMRPEATLGDAEVGCIVEIKSGTRFLARRGEGLDPPAALSANEDVDRMLWVYGLRGRPAVPMAEVIGELIDASSTGGASFELGSACYDMTRIATGQLDAYVEPGPRLVEEVPGMRERFERVGRGAILNNSPYDVAAATLCLEEAGAVVTDARGEPLGPRRLLGAGPEFQISVIAAATPALHAKLLTAVDAGIERLKA